MAVRPVCSEARPRARPKSHPSWAHAIKWWHSSGRIRFGTATLPAQCQTDALRALAKQFGSLAVAAGRDTAALGHALALTVDKQARVFKDPLHAGARKEYSSRKEKRTAHGRGPRGRGPKGARLPSVCIPPLRRRRPLCSGAPPAWPAWPACRPRQEAGSLVLTTPRLILKPGWQLLI